MKALTWHGVHDVRHEEVPDPELQSPTDAIVRVTRSAICGSDLHLYHGTVPGVLPGSVLGHEYVGVIEEAGPGVREFSEGDRVGGPFHIACGDCHACRAGRWHLCDHGAVLGYGVAFGNLAGAQAELVRIPHADVNLRRIPEPLSGDAALFIGDVLTTAYGAVRNADLRPGEAVAVIGCGPVGLCAVQCAVALGADSVAAIDRIPSRLELAERFGANPIHADESDPVARVNQMSEGRGADVVIEAVGGAQTLGLAFDLAAAGGRISAIGIPAEESFPFPLTSSLTRDLTFRVGMANIHRDIDEVIGLTRSGRLDPTPIIDRRLPLSGGPEGYRAFAEREATKIVLEPTCVISESR